MLFLFFIVFLFLKYSWLFFFYIGHATYGRVMKCKHKLDHIEYTVKKIKISYHDREVILRYLLFWFYLGCVLCCAVVLCCVVLFHLMVDYYTLKKICYVVMCREASTHAKMHHKNIVRYHQVFFVMHLSMSRCFSAHYNITDLLTCNNHPLEERVINPNLKIK
jgi:serine/threonine protein kinase